MQKTIVITALLGILLSGCNTQPTQKLIGVMIDNHEDARDFQRGLENAPLVEEQLVEGFITRFIAFFDPDDFPESVGPVRSVRPYFIEGSSPLVSAIFHVGGSPEALELLTKENAPTSFNALSGYDTSFSYDEDSPAPHHRFLFREPMKTLLAELPVAAYVDPGFSYGSFETEESASKLSINYHSPVHNVTYTYDARTTSYQKESQREIRPPSPKNILILETDVSVVGPIGRLGIRMEGSGKAMLFRDGGMQQAVWTKSGNDEFFTFLRSDNTALPLRKGQVWIIIIDSLSRVSWE